MKITHLTLTSYDKNTVDKTFTGQLIVSGKTYYIKVRAYTATGTKKIFGSWSTVKTVKVK